MKISIHSQTVTPESRENGDIDSSDTLTQDEGCVDVDEALGVIKAHIGYIGGFEASHSGPVDDSIWWQTVDADQDIYSSEDTFYSVHITDATPAERAAIHAALTA